MPFTTEHRYWLPLLAASLFLLAGCADGPWPLLTSMNPYNHEQWRQDEAYQPTFHRQKAEIASVRSSANSMSVSQQEHWTREMEHILQTHSNPLLRAEAVETLADFQVASAGSALQQAAKDADPSVRQAACRAWGRRGGKESVQALANTLGSDSDLDVRIAAARELAKFSDPVAYQALGLALDDEDPAMKYRAVESLRHASGRDFGNNLDSWRQFAQGNDPGPDTPISVAERIRGMF